MRLNRFIAQHTEHSRRKADKLIEDGLVFVNRQKAHHGTQVSEKDSVQIETTRIIPIKRRKIHVLLNKPVGYVCSKDGQGSPTVYDLLPKMMQQLNIAGRLDKDSSGLVLLTNDGDLLNKMTHPKNEKEKKYFVTLNKKLKDGDIAKFARGIDIGDERVSKLQVTPTDNEREVEVRIHEGRNRQIRRSFESMGYAIAKLHRVQIGKFALGDLRSGEIKEIV